MGFRSMIGCLMLWLPSPQRLDIPVEQNLKELEGRIFARLLYRGLQNSTRSKFACVARNLVKKRTKSPVYGG